MAREIWYTHRLLVCNVTHTFDLPELRAGSFQVIDCRSACQLRVQYVSSALIDVFGIQIVFGVSDLAGLAASERYFRCQ